MNGLNERFSAATVPQSVQAHADREEELRDSPFSFENFISKISFFREVKPALWDVAFYEAIEAVVDLVIADALVICMEHFSLEVSVCACTSSSCRST